MAICLISSPSILCLLGRRTDDAPLLLPALRSVRLLLVINGEQPFLQGGNIMSTILERRSLVRKPAGHPDETRSFMDGKGRMQVYELGDHIVGMGEFEPGWKWSQHVKPIAGTNSCKASHTGFILQGRMTVQMDDGSQIEYGPNDFFFMPPDHDAWVVGNERCVLIDVTGVAKYAKAH